MGHYWSEMRPAPSPEELAAEELRAKILVDFEPGPDVNYTRATMACRRCGALVESNWSRDATTAHLEWHNSLGQQ